MVENQRLYASIDYEETGRGSEAGYHRVFMRKLLGSRRACRLTGRVPRRSRVFLGGRTRYFTDDYRPENNNGGFHALRSEELQNGYFHRQCFIYVNDHLLVT
jgi:hypothetical protein